MIISKKKNFMMNSLFNDKILPKLEEYERAINNSSQKKTKNFTKNKNIDIEEEKNKEDDLNKKKDKKKN